MAATKKSGSSATKEPTMNFQTYLERHGDYIRKYHRESFKILFKGQRLTKEQWDVKIKNEIKRPIS